MLLTAEEAATDSARPVFPFTAIVGQEQMKLALQLNIIDPKIGAAMPDCLPPSLKPGPLSAPCTFWKSAVGLCRAHH